MCRRRQLWVVNIDTFLCAVICPFVGTRDADDRLQVICLSLIGVLLLLTFSIYRDMSICLYVLLSERTRVRTLAQRRTRCQQIQDTKWYRCSIDYCLEPACARTGSERTWGKPQERVDQRGWAKNFGREGAL